MTSIKNIRTPTRAATSYQMSSGGDLGITAQESWVPLPGFIDPDLSLGRTKERERFLGIETTILGGMTSALETSFPSLNLPGMNTRAYSPLFILPTSGYPQPGELFSL